MRYSGIDWIGKIPESWEVKRMKDLFTERKEVSCTGNEDLLSVSEYYGVARRKDKISSDDEFESRADSLVGYKICKTNDLVINIMLAWKTGLGISDYDGIVSPAYAVYKGKNIVPHYYHYLLRDRLYVAEFKRYSKGIIDSRLRLYNDRFNNISAIYPPLSEQRIIADYLDKKCSEIDRQVSLLTSKRDAYLRLKKSIINRAVTKGLNPNVKMKDSGVDWIGEVPEGWNVMHMKRALSFNNGRDYKHVEVDEGYPVIGSGGQFAYASEYLYDGEAILFGRKGTIDKPMHINDKFWTVDTMFYAIPKGNAYGRYLFYQANAMPLNKYSTQTALPSMTQTSLQNILICLPPLSEQHSIATYLDDKCSKIDRIISNLDKQISKYGELKRSLIDEVITGKRAV